MDDAADAGGLNMGLDRSVTLAISVPATRDQSGQTVPGAVARYTVWAERRSSGSTDEVGVGGTRIITLVTWRLRWRDDLARALLIDVEIEAEGARWLVQSKEESDERRRWIDLETVQVVPTILPPDVIGG